jgi:undecaprenyl-diphosphatase
MAEPRVMQRDTGGRALFLSATAAALLAFGPGSAHAGGGPLGIDHPVGGDASGIWARRNQLVLQDVAPLVVLAGALWEGDDSRFGHTSWQAADALAVGLAGAGVMKLAFSRSRPSQTDDPNRWFQGKGHSSFPSAEVMEITTAITPYVLEYGGEHPAVWALEALPVYDAIARVKSHAHWQSDVLASFVLGSAVGYYMHERTTSISVGILPHGVTVGWKKSF